MTPRFDGLPRLRVEWLVGAARVMLAGGALLATALDPVQPFRHWSIAYVLAWYLVWSLAVLALVWRPARFARGWDVAVHLFDLAVFSLLIVVTRGATSPFFVYFVFLLACGTLRWQLRGALWTAAASMAAYAGVSLYAASVLQLPGFELNTFIIRIVYLTVITVLLGYIGAHQHRFHGEIARLATWPRRIPRNVDEVVTEVMTQARAFLQTGDLVLVWHRTAEDTVNLAWCVDGQMDRTHAPKDAYGRFVLPGLVRRSFQAADARQTRGRVLTLTSNGLGWRECQPIDEGLRARFDMRAVQSWPLDGELIQGRMFGLSKAPMRIDDLVAGELVARTATSRLESLYLLQHLRQSAAFEERVRVAGDLHDSLLQSQAGAALQLLAARRLLERDPDAARVRLAEVQQHLEHSEVEVRSYIGGLRPTPVRCDAMAASVLVDRLDALRRRVQRQWEIDVRFGLRGASEQLPHRFVDDVYRLAQEAVVNAARHAEASVITIDLSITSDALKLEVVDDGRGFPFRGTYDLESLNAMNRGPVTLRHRIGRLNGSLTLDSRDTGSTLLVRVPFAPLPAEAYAY